MDQQPYLQGYLAVDSLWLYLTNGNVLRGGKPVLTGPSIVDSQNIAKILTAVRAEPQPADLLDCGRWISARR